MAHISKQDLEEFKRMTKEMRGLEFPDDKAAMRAAQKLVGLFKRAPKRKPKELKY